MLDYIVCIIFWTCFIIFLHVIGRAVTAGAKSDSYSLAAGYLVYSFPIAAGGMIIQIANIPWGVFAVFVVLLWCVLLGFSIYKMKKENIRILSMGIKQYIISNWVMLGLCLVLIGMLFLYFTGFWLGNHLDDGYYITKAATLPGMAGGYGANYSVGVPNSSFDHYIVNTWELEASVYIKILGVNAALYLRFFQSAFYYFLYLNAACAMFEQIIRASKLKAGKMACQYSAVVTLIFGMYYMFLADTGLLPLRDMFHFNSGMFLGSSVVKMTGIIFLLLFYFDKSKISLKMILGVSAVSIVLISKSTIALPLIVIGAIAYVWMLLLHEYGKAGRIAGIILAGFYFVAAVLLPDNQEIQEVMNSDLLNTLKSPVVWAAAVIFVLSFTLKNEIINKLNILFIAMIVMMAVPEVNDIFELCSVYNFVAGRAWTSFVYFFVLVNSLYLYLLLVKHQIQEKRINKGYRIAAVCLILVMGCGFRLYGGGIIPGEGRVGTSIIHCISAYVHNPYFMPASTIHLGESLEELSQETDEPLRVISPEWVYPDGALHGLAVVLRTYAPDIISVSAANRYGAGNDSLLEGYSQEWYYSFMENPSDKTLKEFKEESLKVKANCVVTQSEDCGRLLEEIGYQYYTSIDDIYYIWYK